MRAIRIHVPSPLRPGDDATLPTPASEHVVRVLRLDVGAMLALFNGDGIDYTAEITAIGKQGTRVRVIDSHNAPDRESPLRITLAQGIARGDKMDWIVQKATELGVDRIVPLITERTEVKLDAERAAKRVAHWQGIVIAACEQSGRAVVPAVTAPQKLTHWLAGLDADSGLRLSLDPAAGLHPRGLALTSSATLVVGPEGGLAPNDLLHVAAAGFTGMRLGPRILRTETAGIAAISALQALFGDIG